MLDSLYIGMSGLISFSKGLTNISNNVANLSTPGFKGTQLSFLDLHYRYQFSGANDEQASQYSQGAGVRVGSSSTRFTQGEFRQTGNDLDVAIDGNGFFVLNKDGQTLYTRAGQFVFDEAGFLSTRDDGARVAGFSDGGTSEISIAGKRSNSPKATATIGLTGSLSTTETSFDVPIFVVFDSLGVKHEFTLKMTSDGTGSPLHWNFSLSEGATEVTSGEVRYTGGGAPEVAFEKHSFVFTPTNGAGATEMTLDFSNSNAFSSSSSNLSVESQDGYGAGFLSKTLIDDDGFVVLSYSNGQVVRDQRLALTSFANKSVLLAEGNSRYSVFGEFNGIVGAPGTSALGTLKTGSVELSNVDLAQEFSELIIIQRGYQASSQVISAANEMIQQLGEIRGRK